MWRTEVAGASVKVATLGPGASFGEEALLKGEPRNATVRMATAGRVLKLGKEDFDGAGEQLRLDSRQVADFNAKRCQPSAAALTAHTVHLVEQRLR